MFTNTYTMFTVLVDLLRTLKTFGKIFFWHSDCYSELELVACSNPQCLKYSRVWDFSSQILQYELYTNVLFVSAHVSLKTYNHKLLSFSSYTLEKVKQAIGCAFWNHRKSGNTEQRTPKQNVLHAPKWYPRLMYNSHSTYVTCL